MHMPHCASGAYYAAPRAQAGTARIIRSSPPPGVPVTGDGQIIARRHDHFDLAAASVGVFLQSDMNFLRSLPWMPLVSASFEHSSDAAVRGFFAVGAIGAVFAAGAGVAGGVVWANAELIKNSDAKAVAAAREAIVIMENTSG